VKLKNIISAIIKAQKRNEQIFDKIKYSSDL